jgi:hypothetical protein
MISIKRFCARSKRPALILLWITTFFIGLSVSQAWADAPSIPKRTVRQIGVMEKIIDKVLIDSPNFLVHGGDNARGLYIDGYGAIFTYDASLVSQWFDYKSYFRKLGERFEITTNEDGDEIIVLRRSKDKDKDEDKDDEEAEIEKRDQEEVYEDGKEEMTQVLLDYGETLSALQDDQWVVLAAFLKGSEYFEEKQISRLVLKAKLGDLRSYSAGKLSESAAISRVVVEEY